MLVVHAVTSEPLYCAPVPAELDTYAELADHLERQYNYLKAAGEPRSPTLKQAGFLLESTNTKTMFLDYVDHAEGGKKLKSLDGFRSGLHLVINKGEPT